MSRVTELLGCRYPIVQGAMGVICNPELVAAVSGAGGYGLLATAFARDGQTVRDQVRATRRLTDRPFGANLFVMNPLTAEFAGVLAEEGVRVVTVSGGSPKGLVPVLNDLGVKFIAVVSTVKAAVGAATLGAAAVVAEGSESGGVQGFGGASTLVLTPAVVDAVEVPVIAAGGIADSRGYQAALALGAEGVQVGTRFIATQECAAHKFYKQTLVESSDVDTGLVNLGRFQVRALRTPLVERLAAGQTPAPDLFTTRAMEEAWLQGDAEAGLLPAGQVAGLIRGVPSVREVIQEMVG
jgi:enoyl-[acyl-carrier protein] reductase II